MGERLSLRDFDIIGLITLDDIQGIEKYVTPIKENGRTLTYLSRSKEYYNVKSMTELALEREELKTKLNRELSKRNFVILENMLNCSGKVYFKKFEEYIGSGKSQYYETQLKQAEECLLEDVRNILVILQNKGLIELNPRNILPTGDENSVKRSIEMDNKAMLYIFAKSVNITEQSSEVEVLTPGYGSVYIGPFFKAIYGFDYTNTLKSKYIEETTNSQKVPISKLMSSERILQNKRKVLLLDDNIGTGSTMLELKKELEDEGVKDIITGAVQYNWRNYYKVSVGDKKDINRFEINDFDFVTPFNYAGHKLYKHAIDQLHSSGHEYVEYLNSKQYKIKECCDMEGAIFRALVCADRTNLDLAGIKIQDDRRPNIITLLDKYKNGPISVSNPISKKIIESIIQEVINIDIPDIPKENIK